MENKINRIVVLVVYAENVEKITTPCSKRVVRLYSNDTGKAIADLLTLSDEKTDFTVIPEGINADMNYKITLDNSGAEFTVSGYELMTKGIKIKIPSALSSELILFEAK